MVSLTQKTRVESIDILRGLVMIIMALDHTRDFFHRDALTGDPSDLATTTGFLFFTRWVTNFCAPAFIFLSGTSIFLQGLRKTKNELSAFLFKRGLWLICVEVIIVSFSWTFDVTWHIFVLQVIWAIGMSMFLMGLIVRLPFQAIFIVGVAICFGHNILDNIPSTHDGFFWNLVRNGNFAYYAFGNGFQLLVIYPFLPWIGLMMIGYSFGKLYQPSFEAVRRKKILLGTGAALILFFVALRSLNIYGDPFPWAVQKNSFLTFLSFINVHKYPPSLLFFCITIGPCLLFLALAENAKNKLTKFVSVYGKVPFFYYILHFYLLHLLCMVFYFIRGHTFAEASEPVKGISFKFLAAGEGYSLGTVYLIWLGVVLALYPLCLWYNNYRTKHKEKWWLSYL